MDNLINLKLALKVVAIEKQWRDVSAKIKLYMSIQQTSVEVFVCRNSYSANL